MQALFKRSNTLQRSLGSAVLGFLGYGAWAFGVNLQHSVMAASMAACAQGLYSFVITFVMTVMLEALYQYWYKQFQGKLMAGIASVSIVCLLVFSGSWMVNVIAGTPEIFTTVLLGYIVGGTYSIWYVRSLMSAQ